MSNGLTINIIFVSTLFDRNRYSKRFCIDRNPSIKWVCYDPWPLRLYVIFTAPRSYFDVLFLFPALKTMPPPWVGKKTIKRGANKQENN